MAKWEIRGIFGNEYAMEQAVEELKKHAGFEWSALDRRNISVVFSARNRDAEEIVKRTFEMYHGFTEHEGPLGEWDRMKAEEKADKIKKEEEKRKRKS